MKKYSKFLYSVLFCVLTCGMLYLTANVLRDRATTLSSFYSEEDDSIDLVIVGSSHVNNGIIPHIFWEESNLSASNVYSWAQPMWTAYHYIVEALNQQDPDIVLLDMYGMMYGNSYMMPEEIDKINYASSFNLDMNWNFLQLIRTSETAGIDLRPSEDFLNLPRFHTRWKNFNRQMLTYNPHKSKDYLKGYGVSFVEEPQRQEMFSTTETQVPYEFCVSYLDKIVELCKKKDVDLIFTMIPYVYSETEQRINNWIIAYAEDHNIPYIDYIGKDRDRIVLDYDHDFSDHAHLNFFGAQKVTRDLAKTLKTMYPDYKKEDHWNRAQLDLAYQKYERFFQSNTIMVDPDLSSYIEHVLNDENFVLYLINQNSSLTEPLQTCLSKHNIHPADPAHFSVALHRSGYLLDPQTLTIPLFDQEGTVAFHYEDDEVHIALNDQNALSIPSEFKAVLYDLVLERPLEVVAYDEENQALVHKEFTSDIINMFKR